MTGTFDIFLKNNIILKGLKDVTSPLEGIKIKRAMSATRMRHRNFFSSSSDSHMSLGTICSIAILAR